MTSVQTKTSLLAKLCTSLVCIPLLYLGPIAAVRASEENNSQPRAKLVWEQAVEAKGGRDRLYSINNTVIVSRGVLRFDLFRSTPTVLESLFVFPNKLWYWNDMRPSVFGLTINMYNYDSRQHFTW